MTPTSGGARLPRSGVTPGSCCLRPGSPQGQGSQLRPGVVANANLAVARLCPRDPRPNRLRPGLGRVIQVMPLRRLTGASCSRICRRQRVTRRRGATLPLGSSTGFSGQGYLAPCRRDTRRGRPRPLRSGRCRGCAENGAVDGRHRVPASDEAPRVSYRQCAHTYKTNYPVVLLIFMT